MTKVQHERWGETRAQSHRFNGSKPVYPTSARCPKSFGGRDNGRRETETIHCDAWKIRGIERLQGRIQLTSHSMNWHFQEKKKKTTTDDGLNFKIAEEG